MPLAQDVAGLLLMPRLQAGISNHFEAEGVAIKIRRLPGVADKEADMVDPTERNFWTIHDSSASCCQSTGMPKRRTNPSSSVRRNENDGAMKRWSCMRLGS